MRLIHKETGVPVVSPQPTSVCLRLLSRVAVCCSVLQCVAVCCRESPSTVSPSQTSVQYNMSRVAVCCSVVQCVSVRSLFITTLCLYILRLCSCSTLQCVAVCCSVLQYVAVCCSVLQCVAVCCSVLQCVAVSLHLQSLRHKYPFHILRLYHKRV